MVEDNPILFEVKSSGTRDRRRARQLMNMKTLREFYEIDVSHGLRGYTTVYRVQRGASRIHLTWS